MPACVRAMIHHYLSTFFINTLCIVAITIAHWNVVRCIPWDVRGSFRQTCGSGSGSGSGCGRVGQLCSVAAVSPSPPGAPKSRPVHSIPCRALRLVYRQTRADNSRRGMVPVGRCRRCRTP